MQDALGLAPVLDAPRQPRRQAQPTLHAAQKKYPAIRRQQSAVKRHAHLLAGNRWKIERQ
jgi:hypothetical protein